MHCGFFFFVFLIRPVSTRKKPNKILQFFLGDLLPGMWIFLVSMYLIFYLWLLICVFGFDIAGDGFPPPPYLRESSPTRKLPSKLKSPHPHLGGGTCHIQSPHQHSLIQPILYTKYSLFYMILFTKTYKHMKFASHNEPPVPDGARQL